MDEVELNPPSTASNQANADSASEAEGTPSLSPPSTPSLPPPNDEAAATSRECCRAKYSAQGISAATKRQKLPPHGGKCIYYACEKCQHMALNRAAFNAHVIECYGRNNSPRENKVIDVQAVRFERGPLLATCVYCEKYTQLQGPMILCHEFICGERYWREEIGDPPYLPAFKFWLRNSTGGYSPPKDFELVIMKFRKEGNWEKHEREYLMKKRLEHLLPVTREVKERELLPDHVSSNLGRPQPVIYSDDKVMLVHPQPPERRRRYKGRPIPTRADPCFAILMGAVYSIKQRTVVGHLVFVGEPKFGVITLEPAKEGDERVTLFHKALGHMKIAPFRRPLVAIIALHDVKTGRVTSTLETSDNPRHWGTDYTILGELETTGARCPGISVTYSEVPTELLKLFSADQLSPLGLPGRK